MRSLLTELFLEQIQNHGFSKNVFFTKEDDEYIPFSLKSVTKHALSLVDYFNKLGLVPGDRVAIISENRIEWVTADFACIFGNFVSVPVYTSLSAAQIKYILENSGSKICFVSGTAMFDNVMKIKNELPDLKQIVSFKEIDESKHDGFAVNYSSLIDHDHFNEEDALSKLQSMSDSISEDDLLTIIYTSGTTGVPKGVMLTHKNIHSNLTDCRKVLTINENDAFLSFLPYSHAYERTAGYYLALFSGAKVYYAQSIETINRQLPETNPTIIITVPRLLDKIYNKLMKTGDEMDPGLKKKIFIWAIKLAHNNDVRKNSIKWKIADVMVYKKIRAKTGNRLRFFVTGGGALNKTIGHFFENIGLSILEGYGMTEASPVISVNHPEKNKYGTVGKPLDTVTVKLSDENEIIVKGDLVMKGYYNESEMTDDMIKDGWLHTGDIGEIDSDGYIKITDRKKSLMKTSGGKYVSPTQIERIIGTLNYIENLMVIGNERMFITALIVPEKNELTDFAAKNGISGSYDELLKSEKLHKLIQKDIDVLQKELAGYERIRNFILLKEPFTIENGELTPTMKVKRKFVEEKYGKEIESMYPKI